MFSASLHAQSVLTWHNDNSRTGQNLHETTLTLANVNSTMFGKKFTLSVDGEIFGQPLYVPNVTIPNQGTHNVVFVATENDSVYAFDGAGSPTTPLWHASFTNAGAGITAVPCGDTTVCTIAPVIGITGTPVIDNSSHTLYVVAFTKENGVYFQRLHALDITTGKEKFGGPVVIQATVPGTGTGSFSSEVIFDPLVQSQRSALLLANGVVYIAWASFGDKNTYHGWVMGYDAKTLAQTAVFVDTPNGAQGGIWQSAGGLSADTSGNIFLQTGNGTFDANTGGADYGDSFLKLNATGLSVTDYFTPDNEATLDTSDLDLGSTAGLMVPRQAGSFPNEVIGAGKQGIIYVVNRDNMGQFDPNANHVVQTLTGSIAGYFGTPAYFNGAVYFSGQGDFLGRYTLRSGLLSTAAVSKSPATLKSGCTPSISANGSTNGIVWAIDAPMTTAVLHAYNAANVSKELYNSTQNATRDNMGAGIRFSVPTVANGRVYIGTRKGATNSLLIYGLL
jgi:hypothetical protein